MRLYSSVAVLLSYFQIVLSGFGWAAALVIAGRSAWAQKYVFEVLRLGMDTTVVYMWLDVLTC